MKDERDERSPFMTGHDDTIMRATHQSQFCQCDKHRYARGETVHRGGRRIRQRLFSLEEKAVIGALTVWACTMVGFVHYTMTYGGGV